ncbi:MAG: hypothetical protein QMC78_03410 [Methanocellales archaeon]|nr:hypothetical protein [Methanocellales archaeon]
MAEMAIFKFKEQLDALSGHNIFKHNKHNISIEKYIIKNEKIA